MSARWRATARPLPGGLRIRVVLLAIVLPLAASALVHAASAADPPPAARRLDADQARREGVALAIVPHLELPAGIVEVRPVNGTSPAVQLFDIAPDRKSAAVADSIDPGAAILTLARSDGSQVQVDFDGLLGASYAPDGAWLAVVDGTGRLWRLDAVAGSAEQLAEGPFLGSPLIEPEGAILALRVASVEAPFWSHLVSIRPSDGGTERLTEEELVYAAQRLADGSLAVVAHRPSGTVIQRLVDGTAALHTDLGPDAVNVSLARNGSVVAWETAGEVFAMLGDGPPRHIGAGSRPRVADDGSAILVDRGGGTSLVDLRGRELAALAVASGLAGCDGCES